MNVEIKWGSGKCNISLEYFFPTSKDKLNRLLKLIHLDYANEEEIISTILSYLKNEVSVVTELGRKKAKLYMDSRQKYSDYSSMLSSGKKFNGVMLTFSEIQQMKKDRAEVKKEMSEHESNMKSCKTIIDKIQRNIEQIESRKGR